MEKKCVHFLANLSKPPIATANHPLHSPSSSPLPPAFPSAARQGLSPLTKDEEAILPNHHASEKETEEERKRGAGLRSDEHLVFPPSMIPEYSRERRRSEPARLEADRIVVVLHSYLPSRPHPLSVPDFGELFFFFIFFFRGMVRRCFAFLPSLLQPSIIMPRY